MRIDVVDRSSNTGKCLPHTAYRAFAGWGDHIMAVGGGAVADKLRINFGAACSGVIEFLKDDNATPAGDNESVPVLVERAGGALRCFVVARRHGAHGVE